MLLRTAHTVGFLKYPATVGDLNTAANIFVYGNITSNKPLNKLVKAKKFIAQLSDTNAFPVNLTASADYCYATPPLSKGTHVISVWQKTEKQQVSMTIFISFRI